MGQHRWILWQGLSVPSMERFIVGAADNGFALSGHILQAHDEAPYVARYMIRVDESWRTRSVEVDLEDGGRRHLSLNADGQGHWIRDGQTLDDVGGCIDADVEWSPSTNTLPIRRLGLQVGESRTVSAAWVRFPSLDVERLEQSYERLADRRYRYRSGRFTADLALDDDGLVLHYGANWKAVATSGRLD
jgi:hypothetical protein